MGSYVSLMALLSVGRGSLLNEEGDSPVPFVGDTGSEALHWGVECSWEACSGPVMGQGENNLFFIRETY